ncbi:MAG TPA: nickel-dependent lactate racemase, partial [Vicinamibacteria bacterium]
TMKVRLDYGTEGLLADVPDERTTVIEPAYPPGVADPAGELRRALAEPIGSSRLGEKLRAGARVAISVCDGTRAQPRELMLRALFEEIPGVPPEDVVILVATGTHRANTESELERMLGREIVSRYRVVNHDARNRSTLAYVGETSTGAPIWLHREWLQADFRITTGFVEPHFFAGFSGGPKMVAPGLAGIDTTLVLHDARRIAHPKSVWGVTEGNPIHDDVREIARRTGVDFAFDVTLNGEKRITAAFAGDLFSEHGRACAQSKRAAMRGVEAPFDVVLTTNSGCPLDQNLYQSVKGMSAAAQIVKEGGVILCASECRDGLPNHGAYASLLSRRRSADELLAMVHEPGFAEPDQWQVQVQSQIQKRARVLVKTSFLSGEELRAAHFEPVEDVSLEARKALARAGSDARLCVLPRGPQTIPYVES